MARLSPDCHRHASSLAAFKMGRNISLDIGEMKDKPTQEALKRRRAKLQVMLSQFGLIFHSGIDSFNLRRSKRECEEELAEITRQIKKKEKDGDSDLYTHS